VASAMGFSADEIERYARHIILPDIGGPGQQKLKQARVLVVGAGGLGSPVIQYLAAAGIGTIGIVDDDTVALSNLQRQIIHDTSAVGTLKTESAERAVARLNPHVKVQTHPVRLSAGNARDLIGAYDIVADGSDNFATRYLVSDTCFHLGKPLASAAVGRFDGSLTFLKPYERDSDGQPRPTYRCLFPDPPPEGSQPTCAEAGILGALTGVLGTLQAMEIVKEIVGIGEVLLGRLLLYDARGPRFETITYRWDPANPVNGVESSAG
jgi:molybdopterin/thiamine biosynthesis adenylyltransferase